MMKTALKFAALALCGGGTYFAIEMIWRGYSHWTMAALGGICFVLIGGINEFFPWEMPLALQGVISTCLARSASCIAFCGYPLPLRRSFWTIGFGTSCSAKSVQLTNCFER